MKRKSSKQLWRSLFIPVFLMTLFLLPLLFILVKRYFSAELIPFSLVNSFIMTGGLLLNIFVFRQLSGRVRNLVIYLLIVVSSAGFAVSGLFYITIRHTLFFLYGMEVMISYILIIFLIITSLSLFSCGFLDYQRMAEKEKRAKEAEKKLREETERQMFSARINPHFLFNSLNLMVSLLDDRDRAEDVLIRLSELLRYNLEASKKKSIPLEEEIASVEKYLFIQKERFGRRLDYAIDGRSRREIPPLLIQPLVENSIKHNLDHCDYVRIAVTIGEDAGGLTLGVTDSEAKLTGEMVGQGTGLEVTRRRVELAGGEFLVEKGGAKICLPVK